MVTSWLCGFFVKFPCWVLNSRRPSFLYWQIAPFVKGRQKGIGAPFVGFEVAENGRREAHLTSCRISGSLARKMACRGRLEC